MEIEREQRLRLIKGALDYSCRIGTTRIGIIPLEAPAPEVDAVVVEQDTHGLLAVDAQIDGMNEPLQRLASQLTEFVPYKGGEVVVKRDEPLQLYAIVHDLDCTPSWREAWIEAVLDHVLAIAARRQLKRIGMAPLGTIHGRFPLERFLTLLAAATARSSAGAEQIWLGVKRSQCALAIELLKQQCTTHQHR